MKKKIVILLIMMILISFIFILEAHAQDINVNDWEPDNIGSNTKLSKIGGDILGVIQVAGTIISIIVLIILGIKYMCGSIEERVQYRKTMIPYLIGSIMLFSVTNIVSIIYKIATDIK